MCNGQSQNTDQRRPHIDGGAAGAGIASEKPINSASRAFIEQEIRHSIRAMREQFWRFSRACPGIEHDALVKGQERLSEAEMWMVRALG